MKTAFTSHDGSAKRRGGQPVGGPGYSNTSATWNNQAPLSFQGNSEDQARQLSGMNNYNINNVSFRSGAENSSNDHHPRFNMQHNMPNRTVQGTAPANGLADLQMLIADDSMPDKPSQAINSDLARLPQ